MGDDRGERGEGDMSPSIGASGPLPGDELVALAWSLSEALPQACQWSVASMAMDTGRSASTTDVVRRRRQALDTLTLAEHDGVTDPLRRNPLDKNSSCLPANPSIHPAPASLESVEWVEAARRQP